MNVIRNHETSGLYPKGLGFFVSLVLLALIGGFSNLPMGQPEERAFLRLTWRMVGQKISQCRTPSEEEQAGTPVHMRKKQICEDTYLPYLLSVVLDGNTVSEISVSGAGLRGDRPVYIDERVELPLGVVELEVFFEPDQRALDAWAEDKDQTAGRDASAEVQASVDAWLLAMNEALAGATRYHLHTHLQVEAGRMALVTIHPFEQLLELTP